MTTTTTTEPDVHEHHSAAAPRPWRLRHGAGFWVVAVAFLTAMAFATVPTPLYAIYEVRDGFPPVVVTLVFGLIHGFGFAADLLSEAIPPAKLAELLVGFNVGVEIGQLTVVSVLTVAVLLLRRARLTFPRAIVVDVCASGLVMIGTYWFVSRSV